VRARARGSAGGGDKGGGGNEGGGAGNKRPPGREWRRERWQPWRQGAVVGGGGRKEEGARVGIARRSSVPLKMAGAPRRFQVPFMYIRERAVQ